MLRREQGFYRRSQTSEVVSVSVRNQKSYTVMIVSVKQPLSKAHTNPIGPLSIFEPPKWICLSSGFVIIFLLASICI